METETVTTLAVNQGWLNGDSVELTTTGLLGNTTNYCIQTSPSWIYSSYPSPARPIKLTLSELQRLRHAARADKALKAILVKFTDQIEISVDFD